MLLELGDGLGNLKRDGLYLLALADEKLYALVAHFILLCLTNLRCSLISANSVYRQQRYFQTLQISRLELVH